MVSAFSRGSAGAGQPCGVCDQPLPEVHHTFCEGCGIGFHLRMLENVAATDCGVVWFDPDTNAMVFLCGPCYEATTGAMPRLT
jgi:hypothetical protein